MLINRGRFDSKEKGGTRSAIVTRCINSQINSRYPAAAMPPDPDRQLMIKAKACQRLAKEAAYYRKETEENEATLVKMRADATKDTYDVKRFEQVLSESQMMIPHSHASLQRNLRELQEMVAAHDGEIHSGGEALRLAMDVLEKETDRNGAEVGEATNVDDLKDGEAF